MAKPNAKDAYITIGGRPLCNIGCGAKHGLDEKCGEYLVCGHSSIRSAQKQAKLIRQHTQCKVVVGTCPMMEE